MHHSDGHVAVPGHALRGQGLLERPSLGRGTHQILGATLIGPNVSRVNYAKFTELRGLRGNSSFATFTRGPAGLFDRWADTAERD